MVFKKQVIEFAMRFVILKERGENNVINRKYISIAWMC